MYLLPICSCLQLGLSLFSRARRGYGPWHLVADQEETYMLGYVERPLYHANFGWVQLKETDHCCRLDRVSCCIVAGAKAIVGGVWCCQI